MLTLSKGFFRGTVAMVVVSVALAAWICVVWWQDKRTAHLSPVAPLTDKKEDEEKQIEMQGDDVVSEQVTAKHDS